ncbi:Hypothetical_protein [Hexamita inflata]|uniref:Hypothetical_protein n=1 Tax=Hexamita inflata TaxID=28002 RepID=A0AA86P8M0_9EUKA|nr:Hypothetical protein HINF_LOCUS21530 [Hexamita inflata]
MQYQTTHLTVTLSSVLRLDSIIPSQILHLTYYVVNNLFLNCAQTYSKFNWGALFLNNNKRDRKGNAGSLFCYLCSFIALVIYGAEVTEAGILGAVGAVLERVSGEYDNMVIVAGVQIVGEVICRIK